MVVVVRQLGADPIWLIRTVPWLNQQTPQDPTSRRNAQAIRVTGCSTGSVGGYSSKYSPPHGVGGPQMIGRVYTDIAPGVSPTQVLLKGARPCLRKSNNIVSSKCGRLCTPSSRLRSAALQLCPWTPDKQQSSAPRSRRRTRRGNSSRSSRRCPILSCPSSTRPPTMQRT